MIVRTGKRAPPPFQRPTLTPATSISYERAFRAAKHRPIDVQGNIYSPGLGELAGATFAGYSKTLLRPRFDVVPHKSVFGRITSQTRPGSAIPLPQMATGTMLGRITSAAAKRIVPAPVDWRYKKQPASSTGTLGRALSAGNMIGHSDVIRGLEDLAGATGIVAVDQVLDLYAAKAKKLEAAMQIVTPASAIAALTGLLLLMGLGGRR
jgi:hypothetical protein